MFQTGKAISDYHMTSITFTEFGSGKYDIRGRYFGGPVFNTSAGFSPIAVVRAGQDVTVSNFTVGLLDGIGDVVVNVSGFLVDDLDFD